MTFQVVQQHLDMSVFCRSNDIIWGCYGANAVHFSFLHEYIARSIGIPLGKYYQISVNWHGYSEIFTQMYHDMKVARAATPHNPYRTGQVAPYPIMSVAKEDWDHDVQTFIEDDGHAPIGINFADSFFHDVALPIVRAHDAYKDLSSDTRFKVAMDCLAECKATDWRLACQEWIIRRWTSWQRAADSGVPS